MDDTEHKKENATRVSGREGGSERVDEARSESEGKEGKSQGW